MSRHLAPVDASRRALLRGARAPDAWLPWSNPQRLLAACVRCGDCARACPEQVIRIGDGGFPRVDAMLGECSFCGRCAEVCTAPVFDRSAPRPWPLRATVGDGCLELRGTTCRLCEDACPESALRFRPRPGGITEVGIDAQRCTGCGACVSRCPPAAIALGNPAGSPGERGLNA